MKKADTLKLMLRTKNKKIKDFSPSREKPFLFGKIQLFILTVKTDFGIGENFFDGIFI